MHLRHDEQPPAGRVTRINGTAFPLRCASTPWLNAAARHAQADALEIEAQAKRRLADEYDAAQQRGEVATQSRGGANIADGVPGGNTVATISDLGLTRKAIHEAQQLRDAEDPGWIPDPTALGEASLGSGSEPPRDFRRLQLLRDWSHDEAYPTLFL